MAVRVEPLKGRPGPREASAYPGVTQEERGLGPLPAPLASPEPPPPLWIIPSDVPQSSRPVGFVGALPEHISPDPPDSEGLFDVPGLLERLWLARALEGHHERPTEVVGSAPDGSDAHDQALAAGSRSGGLLPETPTSAPSEPAVLPRGREPRLAGAGPTMGEPALGPIAVRSSRPRSWVCPYCYLTNDAGATTCRGCRSSSLHL